MDGMADRRCSAAHLCSITRRAGLMWPGGAAAAPVVPAHVCCTTMQTQLARGAVRAGLVWPSGAAAAPTVPAHVCSIATAVTLQCRNPVKACQCARDLNLIIR